MADLRKKRTDADIMRGFTKLLKEKGFSKITIKEIIEESMIHRNTFYLHFTDKYDLLERLILNNIRRLDLRPDVIVDKPFSVFAAFYHDEMIPVVDKQLKDQVFVEIVGKTFFKEIIGGAKDNGIFFDLGKVAAIFLWNAWNGNKLSIFTDVAQLNEIYRSGQIPNHF